MSFDLDSIRAQFPALAILDDGKPRVYFDNPAGTQVPIGVATAMSECLLSCHAPSANSFVPAMKSYSQEWSMTPMFGHGYCSLETLI